jgi:predicted nucleic acid-binding protein
MKSLKIYLDTSVILMRDDRPRGIITREFLKRVAENNYNLIISEVVDFEVKDTDAIKREENLDFIKNLNCRVLPYSLESHNLASTYVREDVLTENHFDDLLHVAYATVHQCDMIVSWNRKHIAKQAKVQKINACNIKNNYHAIAIYTPEEFLIHF